VITFVRLDSNSVPRTSCAASLIADRRFSAKLESEPDLISASTAQQTHCCDCSPSHSPYPLHRLLSNSYPWLCFPQRSASILDGIGIQTLSEFSLHCPADSLLRLLHPTKEARLRQLRERRELMRARVNMGDADAADGDAANDDITEDELSEATDGEGGDDDTGDGAGHAADADASAPRASVVDHGERDRDVADTHARAGEPDPIVVGGSDDGEPGGVGASDSVTDTHARVVEEFWIGEGEPSDADAAEEEGDACWDADWASPGARDDGPDASHGLEEADCDGDSTSPSAGDGEPVAARVAEEVPGADAPGSGSPTTAEDADAWAEPSRFDADASRAEAERRAREAAEEEAARRSAPPPVFYGRFQKVVTDGNAPVYRSVLTGRKHCARGGASYGVLSTNRLLDCC